MVFTSTHLSLRPSLSSTQGLNPFNPCWISWVHFCCGFTYQTSDINQESAWVSISTPDYLSTNRYRKHVKRHISKSVPCATFDHLSPLHEAAKTMVSAIVGSRLDYCWHICFQPSWPAYSLFRIPLHALWPKRLDLIIPRLFYPSSVLSESGFLFVTE